jgi:ferredoxin
MSDKPHIEKVAERFGKPVGRPNSPAIRKIIACAMTDEEAQFLLDLPCLKADLAAKWGMTEEAIDEKLLALARRGLVVSSRKGMRLPGDLTTLHDNILASARDQIPAGIDKHWRELYDGEGWVNDIGNFLGSLPMSAIRTIPVLGSIRPETTKLAPHEDIEAIIRAHADLISVRECCCRTAARKCEHPNDVCMQFGRRAEYDLYRGSGKKVSADEAIAIAKRAGDSGLVPTVTNSSNVMGLDFICFCCGCCCLVINPGLHVGKLDNVLAPSRFVATVHECNACGDCVKQCCVDAIELQEGSEVAVIDRAKCLGCGACVPACKTDAPITMDVVRPPEFIPASFTGPSVVGHMQDAPSTGGGA